MKRRKPVQWVLLGLLGILIGIQFIRPKKNRGSGNAGGIETVVKVPDSVRKLLVVACYDCHSNTTNYPWYAEIMPVGWWMDHHVDEGKRHLNFSVASTYTQKRLDHKLEEVEGEVRESAMPPGYYVRMHPEARLTDAQKEMIYGWVTSARTEVGYTEQ